MSKKLYLIHCGYYDKTIGNGIFENHTNFFVTAESLLSAKQKAKESTLFKDKHMHIDGLQEVQAVDGYRIELVLDTTLSNETKIENTNYRQLAET